MNDRPIIIWFRRDLRLHCNASLAAAAGKDCPLIAAYIDDSAETSEWSSGSASRWWLHHSLKALDERLSALGGGLWIARGRPDTLLRQWSADTSARAVYWNRLYTPSARQSSAAVSLALSKTATASSEHVGHLLFEPGDILSGSGQPYRVFTPFWRRALKELDRCQPLHVPNTMAFLKPDRSRTIALDALGLLPSVDWASGLREAWNPGEDGALRQLTAFINGPLADYAKTRDWPGVCGTSRLSPHLHFGELCPAQLIQALRDTHTDFADESVASFLSELGWRDFAHHVLWEHPHSPEMALQEDYRDFPWRRNQKCLRAWQRGNTGFPVIDAGMRELWTSGWMHNRVRMLVASFLVKDLLIPWQDGAAWFRDTLVDADLANNTLGWQWTAGCGVDASPFFRIFNPVTQAERYDGSGAYVRRWVPELSALPDKYLHAPWTAPDSVLKAAGIVLGENYPERIVIHDTARDRALAAFETWRGER